VSFCNASAGYIIVGLATDPDPAHQIDRVVRLDLLPNVAARAGELLGVIRTHVYPEVTGLAIRWFASAEDSALGLLVIEIPQQNMDRHPFIILHVDEGGAALRHVVVGYAERRGADNLPYDGKQLQQALRRGMDGLSQRLSRIEDKIDSLLTPQDDRIQVDQRSIDASIAARIDTLMSE